MMDLHEQTRYYLHLGREALSAGEQAALDEHLRTCAGCRAYANEVTVLQDSLKGTLHRRWDAVQPETKFDVAQLSRASRGRFLPRAFSYVAGIAALLALVILLQAFFKARLQTADSPAATPGVSVEPIQSPAPFPAATQFPSPTPPSGRDFYQLQRLTDTPSGAYRPAVSPDGRRIAYASERDGNWDIYVLDLATNNETRLTGDPLNDMAPSWSPDGARIAYQHNVPLASGPVLVDYMVMNADGSNKTVVASGAHWLRNEAPQWSPTGDWLAYTDSAGIVVVNVNEQREVGRFAVPADQYYFGPAWFDDHRLLFVGNGQVLMGDLTNGALQQVLGMSGPVQWVMAANPVVAYIGQESTGSTMRVGEMKIDGAQPTTLALLQANSISHAARSTDGQFIAIQTGAGVYVTAAGLPTGWWTGPLFLIDQYVPATDLFSVAWLPDSSGFVFVSAADGKPDLYLARLNQEAIRFVRESALGQAATATPVSPTLMLTATPAPPTPAPTATPGPALTPALWEPAVVMPITDREAAIRLALQMDSNMVTRDRPITAEMIAADPAIVEVQRFATQAESGFGVNTTITDGPVWVVTVNGRGLASMIGATFETDRVSYAFLERTGTLLGTSAKRIAPTPFPTW